MDACFQHIEVVQNVVILTDDPFIRPKSASEMGQFYYNEVL